MKKQIVFFVIVALIAACQPPPTATVPPITVTPGQPTLTVLPDTATPGQPTLTPTPEEPAEWAAPENWWKKPQVWIQSPDAGWDYEDLSKAGLTVASWIWNISDIQTLHDRGIIAVGDDSMIVTYKPSPSSGSETWSESEGSPPALVDAAIRDPFGNIFTDDFGVQEWFGGEDSYVTYSMIHPDWQEHKLQRMKAFIDAGADGYLIDEVAYGSIFYPDFNPYTMQLFNSYLLKTYSKEELTALGAPWGIDNFSNFDYAALVRNYLPADMSLMTLEDWEQNWELRNSLPLIHVYERFLRIENQKVALRLIKEGRAYAQEKYDEYLPISANLNDLISTDAWFLMDKLDFYSNEFPYDQYGYFPAARPIAPLKLAHYFDTPMIVLTQMTTRPDIRAWGRANTVNLYRTMIADATAGGGAFHIETNLHNMKQDLDAIGPYYRFALDYPLLFEDVEPVIGDIGVLHLWETVSYWSRAHFGLCDLLADAGYQFGAIFGAEEFIQWGGETETPAPDWPLNPQDLAQYKVVIVPELYNLAEHHAEILRQYVREGGTLIIFSTQDTTGDMDASLPLLRQILAARGRGATEIGEGKLIHINGVWGNDFLENPDPSTRVQLSQLLEAEGSQPEVRMSGTRYLAATAYTGPDRMVVHFVNYDHEKGADITTPTGPVDVEITLPDDLQLGSPALYLFTPGEMPVELEGVLNGNKLQLTLPSVYIWSVLLIGEEGIIQEEVAAIPTPTPLPTPTPTMNPNMLETGYVIYDDELSRNWWVGAWDGSKVDDNSTTEAYKGMQAIEVSAPRYRGIALGTDTPPDPSHYTWLVFYINIGQTTEPLFVLTMWHEGEPILGAPLKIAHYVEGGKLEPGQWIQVAVPLSDLLPEGEEFNQINFEYHGSGATTFYIDEIRLVAANPALLPTPTPTMSLGMVKTGYAIYGDALAENWWAGTWEGGKVDDHSTIEAYEGTQAIQIIAPQYSGTNIGTPDPPDPSQYTWLVFYINIGQTTDSLFVLNMWNEGEPVLDSPLRIADYVDTANLEPGQWHQVIVPLSDLLPNSEKFDQINFEYHGSGATTFYLDDIRLVGAGP